MDCAREQHSGVVGGRIGLLCCARMEAEISQPVNGNAPEAAVPQQFFQNPAALFWALADSTRWLTLRALAARGATFRFGACVGHHR